LTENPLSFSTYPKPKQQKDNKEETQNPDEKRMNNSHKSKADQDPETVSKKAHLK
jgi:hypothetical protein